MNRTRKFSPELINEAAQLRETGMSCRAIGERLGMSPGAVQWHCLRLGADSPNTRSNKPAQITARAVQRGNHVIRRFTPEEDKIITRMDLEGARIADMARATGRRSNSIIGRLMTLARHAERKEHCQ